MTELEGVATFNLVDEPWIPVVWLQPRPSNVVSLRTLFQEAENIGSLAGDTPIVTGSLYRFLLAVTHSALRGPASEEDWATLWEEGHLAEVVVPYLERHKARFDLFHPQRPFFQGEPDLEKVRYVSPIDMVPHLAYGATLFDHHVKAQQFPLTPEEGARWLLSLIYFGLGGVVPGKRGKDTVSAKDAPCARAILFLVEGPNLSQTLMLNLLPYPEGDNGVSGIESAPNDAPFWEQEDPFAERLPLGYLDYLTWPSRRVRLRPGYVEGKLVVESFAISPGLPLPQSDAGNAPRYLEPMHHYRRDKKKGWLALKFREDRALWRDSAAILEVHKQEQEKERAPRNLFWLHDLIEMDILSQEAVFRLMAIGAATKPGQKLTYFYRHETLPLPLDYLQDSELVERLQVALQEAEDVRGVLRKATWWLAHDYLSPGGGGEQQREPQSEDIQSLMDQWAVERDYWVGLTLPFYDMMVRLPDEGSEVLREWGEHVRRVAREAFDRVADGLGDMPRALKAEIKARGRLEAGLKKIVGAGSEEQE